MNIKAKITESDIRKQLVDYLKIKGWTVIPNIAGKLYVGDGGRTYPGIADLTVIKNGRVVWVEVKRPGTGRQSEKQKEFQADIEVAGGEYVLACCIEDSEGVGI